MTMHRRHFIWIAGTSIIGSTLMADDTSQEIVLDGTSLSVRRQNDRLFCTFTAPTTGWVAVGFNDAERLEGTRFVMAAMMGDIFRFEEHIAQVSGHAKVEDLGLVTTAEDVSMDALGRATILRCSFPLRFADTDRTILRPDGTTYVMCAWSHDTDFDHHSAWRRHVQISV